MKEVIAERSFIFINSKREEFPVSIKIGIPYKIDDVQWACPVEIKGFYKKLADQIGVDSFQALMLAQKLIRTLLQGFIEDGGQILSIVERIPVNPTELFESGI